MAELSPADGSAPLGLEVVRAAERATLRLSGELDLANVGALEEAIAELCEGTLRILAVEAAELDFMDSSGIAALLGAVATGVRVEVLRPTPIVRAVIVATGLSGVLHLDGSD